MNVKQLFLALATCMMLSPSIHAGSLAETGALCRGMGGDESLDCVDASLGQWSANITAACLTDSNITYVAPPVTDDTPALVAANLPNAIFNALSALIPQCPPASDGSIMSPGNWTSAMCGDEIWYGPDSDGQARSLDPESANCVTLYKDGVFYSRHPITAPIACPDGYQPVGNSQPGTSALTDSRPFLCATPTDLVSLGNPPDSVRPKNLMDYLRGLYY